MSTPDLVNAVYEYCHWAGVLRGHQHRYRQFQAQIESATKQGFVARPAVKGAKEEADRVMELVPEVENRLSNVHTAAGNVASDNDTGPRPTPPEVVRLCNELFAALGCGDGEVAPLSTGARDKEAARCLAALSQYVASSEARASLFTLAANFSRRHGSLSQLLIRLVEDEQSTRTTVRGLVTSGLPGATELLEDPKNKIIFLGGRIPKTEADCPGAYEQIDLALKTIRRARTAIRDGGASRLSQASAGKLTPEMVVALLGRAGRLIQQFRDALGGTEPLPEGTGEELEKLAPRFAEAAEMLLAIVHVDAAVHSEAPPSVAPETTSDPVDAVESHGAAERKRSFCQEEVDDAIRALRSRHADTYQALLKRHKGGDQKAFVEAQRKFGRNAIARTIGCPPAMVTESEPWKVIKKEFGFRPGGRPRHRKVGMDAALEQRARHDPELGSAFAFTELEHRLRGLSERDRAALEAQLRSGEKTRAQVMQILETLASEDGRTDADDGAES